MRVRTLRRLASVGFAVLGLLAVTTPPAGATTAVLVVFGGSMWLSDGISYPCVGTFTVDPTKCPFFGGWKSTMIAKVNGTPVEIHVDPGGNTVGFAFASFSCIAAGVSNLGSPVASGFCGIWAAGAVTWSCGFGHGLGVFGMDIGTLTTTTVSGEFHFVDVGGTLVISGGVVGSPTSAIIGVAEAFTIPSGWSLFPPEIHNNCAAKSAYDITIMGAFALVAV